VPLRNGLAAAAVAVAAASGQLEALMLMPLMVIGPFFFLGLSFRLGVFTVALSVVSFVTVALVVGLALPVLLRSSMFLLMTAAACAIAAHYLDKWARRSYLERRLIAELAERDPLTGVKNRRVFDEHLERLWKEAIEESCTIAIVLLDVDHFKAYNDLYGHQAGDQALRRVAQTLQALVSRPRDVLGRYGGEEFAAVLYDVDGREAEVLADRMRLAIKGLGIEHRGGRPAPLLTISVGVAVIEPSAHRRLRGALQLADQALYEAKESGRDKVELMDQAAHGALVTGVFSSAIRTQARR
jgi:diguanylate cyclase (GGDEF)-like protein